MNIESKLEQESKNAHMGIGWDTVTKTGIGIGIGIGFVNGFVIGFGNRFGKGEGNGNRNDEEIRQ